MALRVAIDTNRLTDLFRGDAALAHWLGQCEEVWLPLPVYAEIRAGFLGGTRLPANESRLTTFLAKPTVDLLLPTRETAEQYARLYHQLRAAGTPIPINDVWIGALCIENNLVLQTRDHHFRMIPQLLLAENYQV